jgi:hypothetical protein
MSQGITPGRSSCASMTGKAIWLINFELKDLVEMSPSTAGSAGSGRNNARPEEPLQSEAFKSSLITSRASSVDRKSDTDSGSRRRSKGT